MPEIRTEPDRTFDWPPTPEDEASLYDFAVELSGPDRAAILRRARADFRSIFGEGAL